MAGYIVIGGLHVFERTELLGFYVRHYCFEFFLCKKGNVEKSIRKSTIL